MFSPWDDIMSLRRPTLKHIPPEARPAFAHALSTCLRDVISANTNDSWKKLFMLPKCVLPSTKRAGKRHLTTKRRPLQIRLCDEWCKGEWKKLWAEAKTATRPPSDKVGRNRFRDAESEAEARREAAISHAREGHYSKASRVLTSCGIAPNTDATWTRLKVKHPDGDPPQVDIGLLSDVPPFPIPVTVDMGRVLRSFPADTGCGPSGLRVQHLLDALEVPLPFSLTSSLRQVVKLLASGQAPPEAAAFIAGANLTALRKMKGKDEDVRPIAVGEVLRRRRLPCW